MTDVCRHAASGAIELFFYGELPPAERGHVAAHLPRCGECRAVLEDLRAIGEALGTREPVAAPPNGDWSGWTERLEEALRHEAPRSFHRSSAWSPGRVVTWLAMAAVLALVTASVAYRPVRPADAAAATAAARPGPAAPGEDVVPASFHPGADSGFEALSEQHFERSKLVVLGLAAKDPHDADAADWRFERQLASSLLPDTRLYRRAAEDRGLTQLAGVMSDLELVLLQTSLADNGDGQALPQIQRLIRKRDLVTKMDVVTAH
jgi:hypothetical protein